MNIEKYFSHQGSGKRSDHTASVQNVGYGSSFKERIENNGYRQWTSISENLEFGAANVSVVMAILYNQMHIVLIL